MDTEVNMADPAPIQTEFTIKERGQLDKCEGNHKGSETLSDDNKSLLLAHNF